MWKRIEALSHGVTCPAQVRGLHLEHTAESVRMRVVAGDTGDLAVGERKTFYHHFRNNIDLVLPRGLAVAMAIGAEVRELLLERLRFM